MKNSKNNFKAYFIDLDGTLLDTRDVNGKWTVSDTNIAAIEKVRGQGKAVVLSTGRLGVNAAPYLALLNIDYAVLGNGAQIYAHGAIVREFRLSVRQLLQIHELLQKRKLIFKIDDGTKAWGAFSLRQKWLAKSFGYEPCASFGFEMHQSYCKIVAWGATRRKLRRVATEIMATIPGLAVVSSTHGFTLEITEVNATKGLGDEYVTNNYLQLPRQATAHIGDTMNDATAVGHVGALIAMRNADRDLKKVAQFIGPHFRKGGVAKVLDGAFTFAGRR